MVMEFLKELVKTKGEPPLEYEPELEAMKGEKMRAMPPLDYLQWLPEYSFDMDVDDLVSFDAFPVDIVIADADFFNSFADDFDDTDIN